MSVKTEGTYETRPTVADTPDGEADESQEDLSKDEIFFALSNYRRRYVLHYLKQVDGEADLSELSEQVGAWENGVEVDETTSTQRKRAYVSLRQTHLPKLDDLGIVEFDPVRGTARLTDRATVLDFYLEVNRKGELPWSSLYLGLGVLMSLVAVAVWIGAPPFTALPTITYTASMAFLVTLVALVHVVENKRMRIGTEGAPSYEP